MTQEQQGEDSAQIELRCSVESSMLGLLRDLVTRISRHLGFTEQQINEIELCVDEACANAIEHAYKASDPAGSARDLSIEIVFRGNELTIRVSDQGCGSSYASQGVRDLEEYVRPDRENYRGLGYYMMHKFMDRVDVQSVPGGGTTVEMKKIRR